MELFQDVTFMNHTLNFPFAGLTRDIDCPVGHFRSKFKHNPGQYLKL
jgi:hypothetical protein